MLSQSPHEGRRAKETGQSPSITCETHIILSASAVQHKVQSFSSTLPKIKAGRTEVLPAPLSQFSNFASACWFGRRLGHDHLHRSHMDRIPIDRPVDAHMMRRVLGNRRLRIELIDLFRVIIVEHQL